jgi:hypothetical protein
MCDGICTAFPSHSKAQLPHCKSYLIRPRGDEFFHRPSNSRFELVSTFSAPLTLQFLFTHLMPANIKAKKDYYKVLDLSAQATDDDIRKAYKKLVGSLFVVLI